MTDLSTTIKPKSDQLNSDDLISGPITVTITDVTSRAGDQPIAISFAGDNGKPYLPCKSMRRVLVQIWGNDGKSYIGRSMTIYRDPTVTWAGQEVGGIRISHMTNMDGPVTLSLTATKSSRKPYTVKPLTVRNLVSEANQAAEGGTDELKKWFTKLTVEEKAQIKPTVDKLKEQLKTEEEADI